MKIVIYSYLRKFLFIKHNDGLFGITLHITQFNSMNQLILLNHSFKIVRYAENR